MAPRPYRRSGSSPLTRGKRIPSCGLLSRGGLIPAHAGKTLTPPRMRPGGRAHPRSRGENAYHRVDFSPVEGSSPLTRGKLDGAPGWQIIHGLIPAHAGKTWRTTGRCWRPTAHPRSRGENDRDDINGATASGSSPLTRGKPFWSWSVVIMVGLIPAHAGKTPPAVATSNPTTAHPRSRGENPRSTAQMSGNMGSSPLTRGKLQRD